MRRQKHRIAEYQIEANCHVWHIYIGAHQIISHSSRSGIKNLENREHLSK